MSNEQQKTKNYNHETNRDINFEKQINSRHVNIRDNLNAFVKI